MSLSPLAGLSALTAAGLALTAVVAAQGPTPRTYTFSTSIAF